MQCGNATQLQRSMNGPLGPEGGGFHGTLQQFFAYPLTVNATQDLTNRVGNAFTDLNQTQEVVNRNIVSKVVKIRKEIIDGGPVPRIATVDSGYVEELFKWKCSVHELM